MRVVIDDEGHQLLQEKMVEFRRERRDELGAVLFFVSGEASCRPDLDHVRMFRGLLWIVSTKVFTLSPVQYSSTNFVLLGMIVAHLADGLPLDETDQAYYLPAHLKGQLHFGQNGQLASEWSDVKFYDLTAGAEAGMDWSDKPGIFLGWGASDLAASVPAVADIVYEIYGAQTVTKQVDEMLTFHHDLAWGYEYGLATMDQRPLGKTIPTYGHGGDTYGAQSMAYYSPLLKASVAVASNVEIEKPSSSPQVAYVNCLAWAALLQIEDTAHAYSIRQMCGKRPSV